MRNEVIDIIVETIKDYNEDLEEDHKIPLDHDKSFYGSGSNLDSLGLVSFIIGLEQNIENKLDKTISLADERAMSQKSNPYKNINSLADYIIKLL